MLELDLPEREFFDDDTEEFIYVRRQVLQLEHSLISVARWEARWNKAFLSKTEKSNVETLDYVRCMTISKPPDQIVYDNLPEWAIEKISSYIDAPMTATKFFDDPNRPASREVVTSELIYYWMITLNIPFECQKWHLNRLLALIKVCNLKNSPEKTMSPQDLARRNRELNRARLKRNGTSG